MEPLAESILLTGKYLNAIHETGTLLVRKEHDPNDETTTEESSSKAEFKHIDSKKLVIPNTVEINFTTKEEVYKSVIDGAYNYSSEILLNLLLNEHKLVQRLR